MNCINCKTEIENNYIWCGMSCKDEFYKKNYLGSPKYQNMEREHAAEKKNQREEGWKRFKSWEQRNPGKGFTDYIFSLGEFKQGEKQ